MTVPSVSVYIDTFFSVAADTAEITVGIVLVCVQTLYLLKLVWVSDCLDSLHTFLNCLGMRHFLCIQTLCLLKLVCMGMRLQTLCLLELV
jgi:hypothetical protein